MEKAVEIKRRAQRCVQNGDLDGALNEYEKLVAADGADPYNYVLIADLLYKKGDQQAAGDRYLRAAESYETAGLYKNGIAVCKKMLRLSLAPGTVLRRLGSLHAAAGLGTEASLYYVQHAEQMVRANENDAASEAFIKAFEASPDNAKPLERAAEVLVLEDKNSEAAKVFIRAAEGHATLGLMDEAERCRGRAHELDPAVSDSPSARQASSAAPTTGTAPEPGVVDAPASSPEPPAEIAATDDAPEGASAPGAAADAADQANQPVSGASESAGIEAPDEGSGGIPGVTTIESAWKETVASSETPGLNFKAPGTSGSSGNVEAILAEAQEHFKSGDRDAAAAALARAAIAYEEAGNRDNAATIYRSLSKSGQVSSEVMTHWFENCKQRGDRIEAAQVACEIGDRSMVDARRDEAREWFERALEFDETNELATRRLERLAGKTPADRAAAEQPRAEAAATNGPIPSQAPEAETYADEDDLIGPDEAAAADSKPEDVRKAEPGRVELAVGRGEAVTFDLGSLISEFQRGVDAQLSDDAQSHYDLAMAYREMGLLEQALDSFRIASKDPGYGGRCAEMVGRCLLDQGRFEEAAQEFATAMRSESTDDDTRVSLRYQLGLAYEAAGRVQEALDEFDGVYAKQPNYPDVALKIRVLRKSLEKI